MPKKQDLTRQVFGHLTVIGPGKPYISPKGHKLSQWHCRCDCGNELDVLTHSLRSGTTKSCGHAQFEYLENKPALTSLVGKVFGHLTVVKDDGTRQNKKTLWLCKCDCGKMTHVSGSNLTSGQTISCGHIGEKTLDDYRKKYKKETPGTRIDLLGTKASKNNQLGYRNIYITEHSGAARFRVAVMYKRHQYGGLRYSLEEAIELREELRTKYWPNYKTKSIKEVLKTEGK